MMVIIKRMLIIKKVRYRYVTNLNNMTKDSERMPLEHYITKVSGPLHNQAAQVESSVE